MEVDPINGPPASPGWHTPRPTEDILREIVHLIAGVVQDAEDAKRKKV